MPDKVIRGSLLVMRQEGMKRFALQVLIYPAEAHNAEV